MRCGAEVIEIWSSVSPGRASGGRASSRCDRRRPGVVLARWREGIYMRRAPMTAPGLSAWPDVDAFSCWRWCAKRGGLEVYGASGGLQFRAGVGPEGGVQKGGHQTEQLSVSGGVKCCAGGWAGVGQLRGSEVLALVDATGSGGQVHPSAACNLSGRQACLPGGKDAAAGNACRTRSVLGLGQFHVQCAADGEGSVGRIE